MVAIWHLYQRKVKHAIRAEKVEKVDSQLPSVAPQQVEGKIIGSQRRRSRCLPASVNDFTKGNLGTNAFQQQQVTYCL